LNREYLEDYEKKEMEEYERLFLKRMQDGKFDFKKDRYPPDQRFPKLQKPVALASFESATLGNPWAQVPFCGSLIVFLTPIHSQGLFENLFFKTSEIPKLIDFIKETGRLQVVLSSPPMAYEGIDYLDPFFKELNPPHYYRLPLSTLGTEKEVKNAEITFLTLAKVKYIDYLAKLAGQEGPRFISFAFRTSLQFYTVLKLGRYSVVKEIENLIVDNPEKAQSLLNICCMFIAHPAVDLRTDLNNFTLEETRTSNRLPIVFQPEEIHFPCEIGKFLMKKLTYAPYGLDACKELMYHYDAYDLQKVQKSLNEAIVTNNPDVIRRNTEEFSEILDNVWSDRSIPRRVKGLQIGLPLSMAVIGGVAAGPVGTAGGFLAGLGYSVADKLIDLETEGLSERLAKLKAKSYQANVYDFKKKYEKQIRK